MDPKELKYTRTGEWVRVEGDSIVLGITDALAKKLAPFVYVDLPDKGDDVLSDEPFGQIESAAEAFDLRSPADGVVLAVNTRLVDTAELMLEDAYGKGWIAKIQCEALDQLEDLLSFEEFSELAKGN